MLNFLYSAIAHVVLAIHSGLSPVFGADSGAAWALSIVLLTVAMRLLLFPLFVKQIRAQRAMQALAPKVKELRDKHKGDKETLNREMMALYKEHGANPVAGCLPLVLQLPVFFALFRVLDHIKPGATAAYGFSKADIASAAHAKIFGAPIAAAFNSPASVLHNLGTSALNVQVFAAVLIVLMGASTFFTQKQLLARNGPVDPAQANIQKIMLYVLPFTFVLFGYRFPIGVLLYWLTTNVWSMGQQFFVIRRMPVASGGQGISGAARKSTDIAPATAKSATAKSATPTAPSAKRGLFARLSDAAQAQAQAKTRVSKSDSSARAPGNPATPGKPSAASKATTQGKSTAASPVPLDKRSASDPPQAAGSSPSAGNTRSAKPSQPAIAAVGARRPNTSRAKRKGRRGGRK